MPTATQPSLHLAEVIGALSYALDLTEGQPPGHSLRSCWIGMHIGRAMNLDRQSLTDLFYTLLLKDAGCSSNAARMCELFGSDDRTAKRNVKIVNLQNTLQHGMFVFKHTLPGAGLRKRLRRVAHIARYGDDLAVELYTARCERGAGIARQLGFSQEVADGIQGLDEHWNGRGHPLGLTGDAIPLPSRIALLAQVVDVFHQSHGRKKACQQVRRRAGKWFDPAVVDAFFLVATEESIWNGLRSDDIESCVMALEPETFEVGIDDDRLDAIAAGFGQVIDAKSPFTSGHSRRVATLSHEVASTLGLPAERCRWIWRAGLLHDIGKLGVTNSILDKPGKLNDAEWDEIRKHPVYSHEILSRIGPFRELAMLAGAHHERLDGQGYPHGIAGEDIRIETRIVSVADIYDALTADRPYRKAMPIPKALDILKSMAGTAVDAECVRMISSVVAQQEGAAPAVARPAAPLSSKQENDVSPAR